MHCFEVIQSVRNDQHNTKADACVEPRDEAVSFAACFPCHIVKMYYVHYID